MSHLLEGLHGNVMSFKVNDLIVRNLSVVVLVNSHHIGNAVTVGIDHNSLGRAISNDSHIGLSTLSVVNGLIVEHLHIPCCLSCGLCLRCCGFCCRLRCRSCYGFCDNLFSCRLSSRCLCGININHGHILVSSFLCGCSISNGSLIALCCMHLV